MTEKSFQADRVRNEEELRIVHEYRNIPHAVKRRMDKWICRILHRNWLLKHVTVGEIEGKIYVTERRKRRCKQLLDDPKGKKECCKLKEEALDRTLWRTCFGRGFRPVVRRTAKWMNKLPP
jgi:hypothetical protein